VPEPELAAHVAKAPARVVPRRIVRTSLRLRAEMPGRRIAHDLTVLSEGEAP
jgi:hypothetical protein